MQMTHRYRTGALLGVLVALVLAACGDNSQQQTPPPQAAAPAAQPAAPANEFTVQVNSAPLFESQGNWSDGYKKATGHGNGVVVGPGTEAPNVFAQNFTAKGGEKFKVVAKASSVDKPAAMGRIQINWITADGKFIGVASKAFEVTSQEQTFEEAIVAPENAATGILYVVGNGADDVVRYTEMRLLGTSAHGAAN